MKQKGVCECQRGASAVEFAIVLPLLLIFIFGIIEFGILFYNKAVITNASREGARAGIVYRVTPGADPYYLSEGEVAQVVKNYCEKRLINFKGGSNLPTTTAPAPTKSGSPPACCRTVTVRLNYNFLVFPDFLAAFFGGGVDGAIPLVAETVMRMEWEGAC